ncbi:MAG TPA: alpha-L-fucosidase [Terriglobia bacterium]|nr:alpha-L-fucosidase [Terriglobia bacterium]
MRGRQPGWAGYPGERPRHQRRDFLKQVALGAAGWAAAGLPSIERSWAAPAAIARAMGSGRPAAKYEPTWESLSQYQVPDWYRDAKFGIFLHWGVYSVPAHASEWYPRLMYRREDPVFEWHRQHWGPQSTFGYKDFIPKFRAEHWDPAEWAALFKRAGAKYVVPVGEHHDGFPMYNCHSTDWNAAKMGPRRDVVGELSRAVREQGLKLGVSSHRALDWSYYTFEKDFDTDNPKYSGLYGKPHAPTPLIPTGDKGELRQTVPPEYLKDWFARTTQIVDDYQPDLMWFDFGFEGPEWEPYRKAFGAYYYNRAEAWQRGVVLNYKHEAYPPQAAVLDIERGLLDKVPKYPWQTDTSVGWKSWGYIEDESYKSPGLIVHELVDIVSKNGCLLLNVGPRPDGRIPEPAAETLRQIGDWLAVNGEAIYGTRPLGLTYGEGPTEFKAGQFGESGEPQFTTQDFRFTQRGNDVYAVALAWPDASVKITSLGSGTVAGLPQKSISSVHLLGSDQRLGFTHTDEALVIEKPDKKSTDYACVFKIILNG